MTDSWLPPEGVSRTSDVITVSAAMCKGSDFRCPAADALKARGFRAHRSSARPREVLDHFAFGPFMGTCDQRGSGAEGAEQTKARRRGVPHAGLLRWTKHALEMYGAAFPVESGHPLIEADGPWVYRYRSAGHDPRGAREYEFKVWGRCLQSADGRFRELRLPVNRLSRQPPPPGFVAAAALVLAEGTPGRLPERMRIVEFSLLDGQVRPLFEGSRDEALNHYREHGRDALAAVLDSQEYRPGACCAGCSYVSVCPALRTATGLLGVRRPGRPRRTWSVTNGRNYRVCPARDHMRRLHLPAADAVEHDTASERGRAVHAYLAARHSHCSPRPCTTDVPESWDLGEYGLSDDEYALGASLLRRHAAVCPLRCVRDSTDVRVEPRVVRHDTAADVVVIAAPDLLYRDGDSWVWRETKSSATDRLTGPPLFERYPQLALAVLMVGRGDLGGSPTRARVELEVLRPAGPDLEVIDPFDAANRSLAQRVVQDLVGGWHADDHFLPSPGRACTRCEVARWCPAAHTGEASP